MTAPSLLPGTRIGPYEVEAALGAGGMGEVYRARDTRLDRDVAVKLVPAELAADPMAVERFHREARAIAALNHPNICTIHDIGELTEGPLAGRPYLVMEVVEGRTLAETIAGRPLPLERTVSLAADLADALEAAHAKGIIHRDIKPGNVLVTPRGTAKMLDFGLAKTIDARPIDETDKTRLASGWVASDLTGQGLVVGTMAYMSPEQALGEDVDARSDLFSLGVVLYEMATGLQPFRARTAAGVFNAILNVRPPAVLSLNAGLPEALDPLIARCLEKDRLLRYQTAGDLHADLRRLLRGMSPMPQEPVPTGAFAAAAVPRSPAEPVARAKRSASGRRRVANPPSSGPIDSVVVLPFENQSGNPDSEYLSNGITDSLINSLSKLGKVRVVPRSLAFSYKGKIDDPLAIARALKVRAVVTGRLMQHGDAVMVGAEMMDAATVSQTWGDQYTRKAGDILALQDDVVRDIVSNLRVKLAGDDLSRVMSSMTKDTEAYQYYMRGRFEWDRFTPEGLRMAIGLFERAIERDPTFVMAYVDLARASVILAGQNVIAAADAYLRARALAQKALAIDPRCGGAWFVLAGISWWSDWNGPVAGAQFRQAIEFDPHFESIAFSTYLSAHERHDEAIEEARRVVAVSPTSLPNVVMLTSALWMAGRHEEAAQELTTLRDLFPASPTVHHALGRVWLTLERYADAETAFQRALECGDGLRSAWPLAVVCARTNRMPEAAQRIDRLREEAVAGRLSPANFARACAGLGRMDEAFEWLDRAIRDRDSEILTVAADPTPFVAALRTDPRWPAVKARILAAARSS